MPKFGITSLGLGWIVERHAVVRASLWSSVYGHTTSHHTYTPSGTHSKGPAGALFLVRAFPVPSVSEVKRIENESNLVESYLPEVLYLAAQGIVSHCGALALIERSSFLPGRCVAEESWKYNFRLAMRNGIYKSSKS